MNSKTGQCAQGGRDEEHCSVPGHCLQCLLHGKFQYCSELQVVVVPVQTLIYAMTYLLFDGARCSFHLQHKMDTATYYLFEKNLMESHMGHIRLNKLVKDWCSIKNDLLIAGKLGALNLSLFGALYAVVI